MGGIEGFWQVFAAMWFITIFFTVFRPQRYFNSILLMMSLVVTLLFLSGFFGHGASGMFLVVCFVIAMVAVFLVPLLLIINGIQLIRRESFCLPHLLSILLGIFVGAGEAATIIYVLGLAEITDLSGFSFWTLLLSLSVFYFSFLILSFVVYSIFIQIMPHFMNFDYVIIHGCGLADGERVTKLLSDRVDKAIEIYEKCNVKPVIIPSGGKGGDEKISEAEAMKRYLLEHGIPEDRIILEDRSTTTMENLLFSKEIIDSREGRKKTALVSSNYHVYRCLRLARKAGLDCTGIGAHVAFYYWPSALIREFIAVFLTKEFFIPAVGLYLLFAVIFTAFYSA